MNNKSDYGLNPILVGLFIVSIIAFSFILGLVLGDSNASSRWKPLVKEQGEIIQKIDTEYILVHKSINKKEPIDFANTFEK